MEASCRLHALCLGKRSLPMRTLVQPGPANTERSLSLQDALLSLDFILEPGLSLREALTLPLTAAGLQSAAVTFGGGTLAPFRYVMPGPPDSAKHVAYFSPPHAPEGETRVEKANATFGWQQGVPGVHIHGSWIEADGSRRGGHMLADDCIVARRMPANAWGFAGLRMEAAPDEETNFTLFEPQGRSVPGTGGVLARVRPNEDISLVVEAIAARHGISNAIIRGSLGSLIGARFTDGHAVDDHATEVLIRRGIMHNNVAKLDALVADMQGCVHQGLLVRGDNPVLITFDLVLEALD